MCAPAIPARTHSRTVRMVCSASPKPAPPSTMSGMSMLCAMSPASLSCSVIVSSGSVTALEAPLT